MDGEIHDIGLDQAEALRPDENDAQSIIGYRPTADIGSAASTEVSSGGILNRCR